MPRALTITGLIVAVLVLLIFGLDLALKVPFKRDNWMMDVGFIICAVILGYLSWTAFRELK